MSLLGQHAYDRARAGLRISRDNVEPSTHGGCEFVSPLFIYTSTIQKTPLRFPLLVDYHTTVRSNRERRIRLNWEAFASLDASKRTGKACYESLLELSSDLPSCEEMARHGFEYASASEDECA